MNSQLSLALDEICLKGSVGISLDSLWASLSSALPITRSAKHHLWNRIRGIATLSFTLSNDPVSPKDPRIQRIEDVDGQILRITASESLRDCFLGLYDVSSSELPENQRLALERIALAREKGITQSQLGKEFGIEGNNFFYIVKKLETRGLIVRQQAVVKTLETACGVEEAKNVSCVTTNLIYLRRYAKHFNGLQRLEINKEARVKDTVTNDEECNLGNDLFGDGYLKDGVSVKDYLPEMKSICEKLEHAPGKVLVVRDIKRDLNYSGRFGHRAWRNIRNKLKDANLVQEFDGSVNGKVTRCLRLLKSISSPKNPCSAEDYEDKNVIKFGRKVQLSDQTLELAIDHQIYDMIDKEGAKGALLLEVCGKLGLDRKKNDTRLKSIIKRYGMHKQEEDHKKTGAYRVWTSKYQNSIYSAVLKNSNKSLTNIVDRVVDEPIELGYTGLSCSVQDSDPLARFESKQICTISIEKNEANEAQETPVCSESSLSVIGTVESRKSSARASINVHGALREQRILEKLKNEKFILRSELPRWLSSFEKDKTSIMDRKTVDRILTRLENQGSCKRVCLNIPAITNCGRIRSSIVVLDPSVQNSLPDMSSQILDRIRSFERETNRMSSAKNKTEDIVPVLDIKRNKISPQNEGKSIQTDANHPPLAKMVRAKLLHRFLWCYVRRLPVWDETLSDRISHKNYKPFSLEAATRDMPIEILLLIVGSPSLNDKMCAKSYAGGFRLSDLSIDDYRYIMDENVITHLSRGLELLRRLKLLRLIHGKQEDEGEKFSCVNFTHALEMNPYIEEPPSMIEMRVSRSNDLRPRIRHDFVLQNEELFDEYWNTLEYCYAASDSKVGLHSFPGSVVPEVFHHRSWTSVKGLSAHHHSEIVKSISNYSLKEKIPFKECEKLARDLNITLHQVLSVYYGNYSAVSNPVGVHEGSGSIKNVKRFKRKRLSFANSSGKLRRCANVVDHSTERELLLKHDYDTELEAYENSATNVRPEIKQNENDKSAESLRFIWTDEADRWLVMQYARNRAIMGATKHRVDWAQIVNLPAKKKVCIKRMCCLKRNREFRKALMKFCTFLCQRYAKDIEELPCNSDEKHLDEDSCWDDFNDESVKKALDDVFLHKQIGKPTKHNVPKLTLESFNLKNHSDVQPDDPMVQNLHNGNHLEKERQCIHQKNVEKHVSDQLRSSLAISNAVELLKLIFLQTTASSDLELGITETLRNYSEHDLLVGFTYLRDQKIVIGGTGKPFFLSQLFMQMLQRSPFPHNTGKRASQFSDWINENDHQLTEGVQLSSDLECGDLFHLFFLLSSGEFSVSPCLPEKGVGEAEERRNGKRKSEDGESHEPEQWKKVKFFNENDPTFRRDKGFPGITVSLQRTAFSLIDTLSLAPCEEKDETFKEHEEAYELPDINTVKTSKILPSASCWEGMVNYTKYMYKLASSNPKTAPNCDVFKSLYIEIQKAGDQGLESKKIKKLLPSSVKKSCEEIVETLISFQRVIKVNAYDSIRIVDALYRSKYFLSFGNDQQCNPLESEFEKSEHSGIKIDSGLHKVTFLNGPRTESPQTIENNPTVKAQVPILPWFNGDGSVNKEVYRGLVRRVLGIVMQNPGILKESIIQRVDVLNPQSCRCLLDTMILDNYVIVKKMHQSVFFGGSLLLRSIMNNDVKHKEIVYRDHFFANCKFSSML